MKKTSQALMGLALWCALTATGQAASTRWDTPVTEFAHKIYAVSGPGTATLDWRNRSSLPPYQADEIRSELEAKLSAEGVKIRGEHEASVGILVTLSENRRGWLWIAQVEQGTEMLVTMLEVPQERAADDGASEPPMSLQGSLLLSTDEVLLDAQPLQVPQGTLAALTTKSVVLYAQQDGRWQPSRTLPIPLQMVLPRDPRGRIVPGTDHPFDLYLPGETCPATSDDSAEVVLQCVASDDPWPLDGQSALFNSARNYFAGAMVPGLGRAMPPFYSAAMIPRAKYALWLFAGLDGGVTSYDGTNLQRVAGAARDWGSDIAAVHTDCGSGTQVLATASGTAAASDSLQAFELADREPLAASAALNFQGNITALWAAPGAGAATAVVHSAKGGYDAYRITLACNR